MDECKVYKYMKNCKYLDASFDMALFSYIFSDQICVVRVRLSVVGVD